MREDEHVQVTDDDDAIKRCQQGDIEGLATLIRRYQADALRLAYLLTGDGYLAEDIVQDSFLQVYRAASRFRLGRPFQPWFHQIVTNATRMRRRATSRRHEASLDGLLREPGREPAALPGHDSSPRHPVRHAERMEDRAAIGQALALLTEKQREAVALRYYFGYGDDEIATILGCRVNTARHRIYDGLRALEQIIQQRFPWLLRESWGQPTTANDAANETGWRDMLSSSAKERVNHETR
jgi:RNA polymerase sigma-70 factor (ECF subfamily)